MSSRRAVESAKAVLALCSATDPWFPKPSQATVLAWSEHVERTNFTKDELLEAVRTFYGLGGDLRPRPGDIINTARTNRQDQFMRQPLKDIEAHNDAIDARLAPYIDDVTDAKSVNTALKYQRRECNPLSVPCPYAPCRAIPGRRCKSGSQTLRGYHHARIDAAESRNTLPPGTQQ